MNGIVTSRNRPKRSLGSLGSRPTLGEITHILNGRSDLWDEADHLFSERADYRMWRLFFSQDDDIDDRNLAPVGFAEVHSQLDKHKPEVVWGLFAILSSVFSKRKLKTIFSQSEWQDLLETCDLVLGSGLNLIQFGETSCAFAELFIIGTMQQHRWAAKGHAINCVEAKHYLERVGEAVRKIDPDWEPGWNLNTRPRSPQYRNVLSFDPIIAKSFLPKLLVQAANTAREVANRTQAVSEETDTLLNDAVLFCLSAWRFSRSLRNGETKWRKNKDPNTLNLSLPKMLTRELVALREATYAAWAAGQYLTFPVLAHLYLWCAEDAVIFSIFRE
jgi:hypothetical protein